MLPITSHRTNWNEPKLYPLKKTRKISINITNVNKPYTPLAFISKSIYEEKKQTYKVTVTICMSINNWFCLLAPAHPNHIISVRYFIMNCARCAWAYITTAEIYCGHVRWRSFWFSECFADWLHSSCIAVGCDQQLVRWVVTPPAQHHTGTQHPQHLQAHSTGMKGKLLLQSLCPWKAIETFKLQELMISYLQIQWECLDGPLKLLKPASWQPGLISFCQNATM